jgi:hypothetical protein
MCRHDPYRDGACSCVIAAALGPATAPEGGRAETCWRAANQLMQNDSAPNQPQVGQRRPGAAQGGLGQRQVNYA